MSETTKFKYLAVSFGIIAMFASIFYVFNNPGKVPPAAIVPGQVSSEHLLKFDFEGNDVIEEAPSIEESVDPYWWVNSGARIYIFGGTGKTIIGELPETSGWRFLYNRNYPDATDSGTHPQNIFRLLTKAKAENFEQSVFFSIYKIIQSGSSLRNESNGVFLFGRYQNGNNFYISGVRVDGMAVIKKKVNGVYYTMDIKRFYGDAGYHRTSMPNYLPINTWLGIKSIVLDGDDGSVTLRLFVWDGVSWIEAISAVDDGKRFGGKAFRKEGYAGIRTDFMEIEFDNYALKEI